MNLIAICPTFNRPHCIPNVLAMWQAQDYAGPRHLIVYDDGGQLDPQSEVRWEIASTSRRHPTLGEKFDALVVMAIGAMTERHWAIEETAVALFEDDDVYFPGYLAAHMKALQDADWSVSSRVMSNDGVGRGKWHVPSAVGRHHGAWAYRLSAYLRAGGYPREQTEGFDFALGSRFRACGIEAADTLATGCWPIYLYRWFSVPGSFNGSRFGAEIMLKQGTPTQRLAGKIVPKFDAETAGYYREFGFATPTGG